MKDIEKSEAKGKARFVRAKPEITAQDILELAKQRGLVPSAEPESSRSAGK